MRTDAILQIEQLTTEFRSGREVVTAVDRIDIQLFPGETLGMVGESGSGKSVTSLAVMRLVPNPPGKITEGKIWFKAHDQAERVDLLALPEQTMRTYRGNRIAMIFQEPMTSLNPVLTCGYQVDEALQLHRRLKKSQAKRETIAWFERVKLPDPERMYRSYPHQLSGGQKQRVMIAMALACEPDVLIADEPTTALDVTVQKAILALLRDLQKELGLSILFITHDLGVIAEIAERVVVMYKGEVVEQGSVKDIFDRPQHPYTRGLLACRPSHTHRLRRLPVVSDFMYTDEEGHTESNQLTVAQSLSQNKWDPSEWEKRQEKLASSETVLEVKDLVTRFETKHSLFGKARSYVHAVNGVSLSVRKGETIGLVGESGCGKTTLGRTLIQLVPATSGTIRYSGMEVSNLAGNARKAFRKKVQMVFQDPYGSLNPRMTIGAAIQEPMAIHGLHGNSKKRKEQVKSLLETVGLSSGYYDRYPHQFSGGQRQRIVIARALAVEPEFLICDESVSALDVSVQAQVLNLLVNLREQFGLTMIFISHDLSVVKFLSDRILVMKQGEIVEEGDAEQIYAHPQNPYTRKLIEAIPGIR